MVDRERGGNGAGFQMGGGAGGFASCALKRGGRPACLSWKKNKWSIRGREKGEDTVAKGQKAVSTAKGGEGRPVGPLLSGTYSVGLSPARRRASYGLYITNIRRSTAQRRVLNSFLKGGTGESPSLWEEQARSVSRRLF